MNLQKSTVDLWKWQYIIYPPFSNLHHSQVQLLCSGISFILGRFGHAVSSTYFGVCWLELHIRGDGSWENGGLVQVIRYDFFRTAILVFCLVVFQPTQV